MFQVKKFCSWEAVSAVILVIFLQPVLLVAGETCWVKKPNVAQYGGGDWSGLVKTVPNTTVEQAKQIAAANPQITFFFYTRQYMYLGGINRQFVPGDAVFFSGQPHYGSAGQTDSYEKLACFDLKQGKMANYGASPWYTNDIMVGTSSLKFSLDSGANFTWATSDICGTGACNAHSKVNTSQRPFVWIDKTTKETNFGPWGSMGTWTGQASFNSSKIASVEMRFLASVFYAGEQFESLAWDGGIGFPSNSAQIAFGSGFYPLKFAPAPGSGFYFHSLYVSDIVKKPTFSIVTHSNSTGSFYLGGEDPNQFIAKSAVELQPNTTGGIPYIWGTSLYSAALGKKEMVPPKTCFYLDTGSSLFKGDSYYITPILELLYSITDSSGSRIFEKVYEKCCWVSLVYREGGSPKQFADILPDFTLTMGQTCAGENKSAQITLSPEQYSYVVEEGDLKGQWVPAFAVLDGVGGLLVGSTFMDLLYTTFNYVVDKETKKFSQGNMRLYKKSSGEGPKALSCVPTPSPSSFQCAAPPPPKE